MSGKTLFDKIWNAHVVANVPSGPTIFYIDTHFTHEVTSAQAYAGLDQRGIKVRKPKQTFAAVDHNIPTKDQHLPIKEELSRLQVKKLGENTANHGVEFFGYNHPKNGIIHVIGPELGITLPGKTIVCGDSHTSTHGAFGCIAFGIGTSEVEMVLATQTLLQVKPKRMRISIDGELAKGVTAKDIILYIIAQLGAGGGTGYFVEFAGSTICNFSMEERMTVCNMSIEMGARGGLIAPDEKTFEYIKGRERAPKGEDFEEHLKYWKTLKTDDDAKFDRELNIKAGDIEPMITYGSSPGMGIGITQSIPALDTIKPEELDSFKKSLAYFDFEAGQKLLGKKVDYVFLGSCTNGRIEDFKEFANFVKGKKKHKNIVAWLVPGSKLVEQQIKEEGVSEILEDAGFEIRQPGCSACLAMNEDKVPEGKYAVSTSNRNFEGRQGPGSRTMLASPLTAAAAAIAGEVVDPREFL